MSTTGEVTAVIPGQTTISASVDGKTGIATVTVVAGPVVTVDVAPVASVVEVTQTVQLGATAKDAGGFVVTGEPVAWVSSAPGIASVSNAGLVTGIIPGGPVTVTAAIAGKTGAASISVVPGPVATVQVTPSATALLVGQNTQLAASAKDAQGNTVTGRPVTWTSANSSVVSVSTTGVVSAIAPGGPVTITATIDGQSGVASVTAVLVPVATVEVAPTTATVLVNGTVQLTATAKDGGGAVLSGRPVQWVSANPAVATVSSLGLVTGVSPGGPVSITATVEGQSANAAITVAPIPVATVEVSPVSGTVGVGLTAQLTATTKDAQGNVLTGRTVTWQSGSTSTATVSSAGLVTGVAPDGPVTVTASAEGQTGSAVITVVPGPVASVTVTPSSGSVGVGLALALSATARDGGGNFVTGRPVAWTTSDAAVATASLTGVVTGVSTGPVTITATVDGHSGIANVAVVPGTHRDTAWAFGWHPAQLRDGGRGFSLLLGG